MPILFYCTQTDKSVRQAKDHRLSHLPLPGHRSVGIYFTRGEEHITGVLDGSSPVHDYRAIVHYHQTFRTAGYMLATNIIHARKARDRNAVQMYNYTIYPETLSWCFPTGLEKTVCSQ